MSIVHGVGCGMGIVDVIWFVRATDAWMEEWAAWEELLDLTPTVLRY